MTTTTNVIDIGADPAAVFAVLDDARAYARWVVGTRRIRHVDEDWPAEGARFHHAVGNGAGELHDWSRVAERRPPNRLVLDVRFRPVGTARLEIDIVATAEGSRVEMRETPTEGPAAWLPGPVSAPLLWCRNWLSLQRFRHEVEQRTEGAPAA